MAPHSSTLAWKIPWTEEPGRLQTVGSRRVGHDWEKSLSLFTFLHWRRKWQPTPVFLPGECLGTQSTSFCGAPWSWGSQTSAGAAASLFLGTLGQTELCDGLPTLKEIFYSRVVATETKTGEGKLAMSPPVSDLSDSSYILNFTYWSCQFSVDSLWRCDWNQTAPQRFPHH